MKKYSLKKAALLIFLSTLLISGTSGLIFWSCQKRWKSYAFDSKYSICAILQTGPEWEALKTSYLAEAMGLSVDRPTNLFNFNCQTAQKKLLNSHIIKEASVKKIKPGTVYVDYVVRKPIAYLGDFSNTGIDEEGVLFPTYPFFTPKRLPEIYFGKELEQVMDFNEAPIWGKKLEGFTLNLAFHIINLFSNPEFLEKGHLLRIDLSSAFENNLGRREIILIFEEKNFKKEGSSESHDRYLRLSVKNYQQEINHFLILEDKFFKHAVAKGSKKSSVIDLRIPQVAYILDY